MRETVTLDVPETTTSRFVIATDHPPTNPSALVPWQVIRPYAKEAAERLGGPRLTITSRPAADSPVNLSAVTAIDTADEPNEIWMRAATHHVEVSATVPVTDQPRGVQIARAVARAIAAFTHGVLADLTTGRLLRGFGPAEPPSGDHRREQDRFCLGDEWMVAGPPSSDCPCGNPEPADDNVDGCRQVRLTTRGLGRFGLPELRIDQVSCRQDLAALNLLRSMAGRMLTDHWTWLAAGPAEPGRAVPRRFLLGSRDHGRFWNCDCDCGEPATVRLTTMRPGLIDVGPPPEFSGSTNDWLFAVTPPWAFRGSCCGRRRAMVAVESGMEPLPDVWYPELSYDEKGRLLDELLILAPEFAETADNLAGGWLSTAGRHGVARDVRAALTDLPKAPNPETASWQLSRTLQPFYADLHRRSRLGRTGAATELAVGILRALHVCRDGPFPQTPDLADEQIGILLRICGRIPISLPLDELDRHPPSPRHGIRRAD